MRKEEGKQQKKNLFFYISIYIDGEAAEQLLWFKNGPKDELISTKRGE
jgi:hypothetical protein